MVKHLGETNERKLALTLRIVMIKSVKTLKEDQAEEAGSAAGQEQSQRQGWG